MADNNDTGDKTEQPTPKKLRDLRKKGQVPKSKDLTQTIGLIPWILIALFLTGFIISQLTSVFFNSFEALQNPSKSAIIALLYDSLTKMAILSLTLAIPVIVVTIAADFAQIGAMMTTEKLKLNFQHLDLGKGLKKMFSMDNLIELVKSLIKIGTLGVIFCVILGMFFDDILQIIAYTPAALAWMMHRFTILFLISTLIILIVVSAIDAAYQKFSFLKKNRMSLRDIKQEYKDTEGDPIFKQERRQKAQEWAQEDPVKAAGKANVVIVNPTHIALALKFDAKEMTVPVLAAKGSGELALKMRREAMKNDVPIIQNIKLARDMYGRVPVASPIPNDLFKVVAEVIVWAQKMRMLREARKKQAELENSTDKE